MGGEGIRSFRFLGGARPIFRECVNPKLPLQPNRLPKDVADFHQACRPKNASRVKPHCAFLLKNAPKSFRKRSSNPKFFGGSDFGKMFLGEKMKGDDWMSNPWGVRFCENKAIYHVQL